MEKSFSIPSGTKLVVSQFDDRIILEFVPEKVEFKDGDILSDLNGRYGWIAIFKRYNNSQGGNNLDYHAMYLIHTNGLNIDKNCLSEGFNIATESERQQLFTALKEKGLKWNAETLKVEKIRWRAEFQGNYWSFTKEGIIPQFIDYYELNSNLSYTNGFYFQTQEQAQSAFDKVKEMLLKL